MVGLGEVEDAQVGRDGGAAEVVGGAELALALLVQVRRERRGVARGERRRAVVALLLMDGHGRNSTHRAVARTGELT
jgi:hypothetical protein